MPNAFAQVSDDEVIDEFAGNPIEIEQDFVWLNSTHIQTNDGVIQATVVKAGKFNVDVDTNHPLAGKTLGFDVEVVDVCVIVQC